MMRLFAVLVLIFFSASSVLAGECGNGLPCGQVPWNLPALPALKSPTPMATFAFTATPSPTYTPTPVISPTPSLTPTITNTPTVTNTPTPELDTQQLIDQIATLNALLESTPIEISDPNGTPVAFDEEIDKSRDGIRDLFGRVKGIMTSDFGPFQPIATAGLVIIVVTFLVIATGYIMPLAAFISGIIRKIVTLFLDFTPL